TLQTVYILSKAIKTSILFEAKERSTDSTLPYKKLFKKLNLYNPQLLLHY
ncbi:hypothetical protein PRABACTJOHN_00440, partial [Parabacteroides johnsonii DSM 18315]